jgi:(4-(4-[2-(gamma-L-glutamylamino)ethyl]phenoxymethyl)furan-2-yl)methanamine synthase
MRMKQNVIGLDVGGANLKAATIDGAARSQAFELWKGPEQLGKALADLLRGWTPGRLAVTMTGELCDCFATKRDGVERILAQIERAFPGTPLGVWSTDGRFVTPNEARQHPLAVAAANWHALATAVGASLLPGFPARKDQNQSQLLVDVGSTTADIIPVIDGKPASAGLTDSERLNTGELVYTGCRRTPICALLQQGVMAEFFATTLDVYLLLGVFDDDLNDCQTADGRPATKKDAHARLARMVGGDSEITPETRTHRLASDVHLKQRGFLADAIRAVVGRMLRKPEVVVLSGSGEFLARSAWQDAASEAIPIKSLQEILGPGVSTAACAYAAALLS